MCQTPNLEVQGTVLAGHFPENQSGLVEPARRPVLKAASGIALGEAVLQFDLTGPGVLKCIPYLPAYKPHFFQGKNVRNLGCGLYAGTRVLSSLICKISRHTQSEQQSD